VLFGSSADRSRADEWSDHDFAVITDPEHIGELRTDLSWLPDHEQLVAWAREHHDGFKAIDIHGSVIEFAVTDLAGLATFFADAWAIAYGGEEVEATMRAVAAKPAPNATPDPHRDVAVFLAALLVGVGRARRGERISATGSVRGLALQHLLLLLTPLLPPDPRLDTLDPTRRFELAHPILGRRIADALDLPLEECARTLLDVADDEAGTRWGGYPKAAVAVVRDRLGWTT
jgi:hypothetical protein